MLTIPDLDYASAVILAGATCLAAVMASTSLLDGFIDARRRRAAARRNARTDAAAREFLSGRWQR